MYLFFPLSFPVSLSLPCSFFCPGKDCKCLRDCCKYCEEISMQNYYLNMYICLMYVTDNHTAPRGKRQGPYFPGHSVGNLKPYHLDHTLGAFVTKRFLTVQFIGLSHISPHINTYIESPNRIILNRKKHTQKTHIWKPHKTPDVKTHPQGHEGALTVWSECWKKKVLSDCLSL